MLAWIVSSHRRSSSSLDTSGGVPGEGSGSHAGEIAVFAGQQPYCDAVETGFGMATELHIHLFVGEFSGDLTWTLKVGRGRARALNS
jgi:hypothetical protein